MQGKVLFAFVLIAGIVGVAYLRTTGPRCGSGRCDRREYCVASADGDDGASSGVCEPLPDDCGFWPTCSCVEHFEGDTCKGSVFGQITVETEGP